MLLRLMAPILSFTAEEAWAVTRPPVQGEPPDSVFLHTWNEVLPRQDGEKELLERWGRLREIRAQVARELEALRVEGRIGSSLQAGVTVHAAEASDLELLRSLGDDLKYVFMTSSAAAVPAGGDGGRVEAFPLAEKKCERCWHYRADVGSDARHPTICARCVATLAGRDEERAHA